MSFLRNSFIPVAPAFVAPFVAGQKVIYSDHTRRDLFTGISTTRMDLPPVERTYTFIGMVQGDTDTAVVEGDYGRRPWVDLKYLRAA